MADIITLEDFKTYKSIKSTDRDEGLRIIVGAVNQFVKTYCNRTFVDHYESANSITSYQDGTASDTAYLDEFPVKEVLEVAVSSDGGVTYTTLTENEDYFVDKEEGLVLSYSGNPFILTRIGHKSLKITYTGGYQKPPKDLVLACLDLVEYYKEEAYTPKKSLGGSMVTQFITEKLPPHVKRTLDLYRVVY